MSEFSQADMKGYLIYALTFVALSGLSAFFIFEMAGRDRQACKNERMASVRASASVLSINIDTELVGVFGDVDMPLRTVQRTSDKLKGIFSRCAEVNGATLGLAMVLVPEAGAPIPVATFGPLPGVLPRPPEMGVAYEVLTDSLALAIYPIGISRPDLSGYIVVTDTLTECSGPEKRDTSTAMLLLAFGICLTGGVSALLYYALGSRKLN